MKTTVKAFSIAALLLSGCVHDRTAARRVDHRTDRRADHRADSVVYTGSNIPQPRNRVTASPLSADTPSGAFARSPDSLVPTEPVVGATDNSGGLGDTGPTPRPH